MYPVAPRIACTACKHEVFFAIRLRHARLQLIHIFRGARPTLPTSVFYHTIRYGKRGRQAVVNWDIFSSADGPYMPGNSTWLRRKKTPS
jgi:hypothetical protein